MTDLEWLVLLVALLYLSECSLWTRRGSVAFRSLLGARHQPCHPSQILGNQRGGPILLNPLPPFGSVFVCSWTPLSLDAGSILSYVAQCIDPAGRPVQQEKRIPFDQVRDIGSSGHAVLVNANPFLRVASDALARSWAHRLAIIWKKRPSDRESAIDQMLKNLFDVDVAASVVNAYHAAVAPLKVWCHVLFALFLVLLPLGVAVDRLHVYWRQWIAAVVICVVATAIQFWRTHRKLLPEAVSERWRSLAVMILTPTAGIRACDALTRDLLANIDPLAAATVLCDDTVFGSFAARVFRDLREPLRPVYPASDPVAQQLEEGFRGRIRAASEGVLKGKGNLIDAIVATPTPSESASRSYCPRCQTQFNSLAGACEDCGGIPFKSLILEMKNPQP